MENEEKLKRIKTKEGTKSKMSLFEDEEEQGEQDLALDFPSELSTDAEKTKKVQLFIFYFIKFYLYLIAQ